MRDSPSSDEESQVVETHLTDHSDAQDQVSASRSSGAGVTAPHLSQMESKLDLILKKVQSLEDRNQELEKRVNSHQSRRSVSHVSHSSPKRPLKCSKNCEYKQAKKGRTSGTPQLDLTSDSVHQDLTDTHYSSIHASQATDDESSASQPSLQWLNKMQRHNVKCISSYKGYRDSQGPLPLVQAKVLNLGYTDLGTMKLRYR